MLLFNPALPHTGTHSDNLKVGWVSTVMCAVKSCTAAVAVEVAQLRPLTLSTLFHNTLYGCASEHTASLA